MKPHVYLCWLEYVESSSFNIFIQLPFTPACKLEYSQFPPRGGQRPKEAASECSIAAGRYSVRRLRLRRYLATKYSSLLWQFKKAPQCKIILWKQPPSNSPTPATAICRRSSVLRGKLCTRIVITAPTIISHLCALRRVGRGKETRAATCNPLRKDILCFHTLFCFWFNGNFPVGKDALRIISCYLNIG